MDIGKLTIGEGSAGSITMPVLMLFFFTLVAGAVIMVLGSVRKKRWIILLATLILLICAYCVFLAGNTVRQVKKADITSA